VLALSCCCGWPGTIALSLRMLTASPLCVPALLSGNELQPLDFFALCNEAAAAGAAAMLLPSAHPLSLMHLAVASGSAETVKVLLFWLQDCCWAPAPARDSSSRGTLAGEPWLTAPAHAGMSPVHLAALLPRRDVAEVLLSGSLVACAVWLALPCTAGLTPAALAAARGGEQEGGPWAAEVTALARARLLAMLREGGAAHAHAPHGRTGTDEEHQHAEGLHAEEDAQHAEIAQSEKEQRQEEQPEVEEQREEEEEQQQEEARPGELTACARAPSPPTSGRPPLVRVSSEGVRSAAMREGSDYALPPLRVISTTSCASTAASVGSSLYKRAPPSFTSSYDDIPSPHKGPASPEGKMAVPASGSSAEAVAAPRLPPPPLRLRAGAVAPMASGSQLLRMFEGLSFLLLLSLGVEVIMVPSPKSTVGDFVELPLPAQAAEPAEAARTAPEAAFWTVAAHAAHAMPLAALVGLVLTGMLCAGLAMAALDRARARRAARAAIAARGGSGAEVWPPAFASERLEEAYEEVGGLWLALHGGDGGTWSCGVAQGDAWLCMTLPSLHACAAMCA
jgi:hypothetical protein